MRKLRSLITYGTLIEPLLAVNVRRFAFSKKRLELSTHKGFDENLANGFVTINIKHRPEIEAKLNPQEKKEQFVANSPILDDICTKLKEDERKEDQLKYINVINEQQELPPRK
jgi:hypothetical protein